MDGERGDGAMSGRANELLTTRSEMQELNEGARGEPHNIIANQKEVTTLAAVVTER